MVYPLLTVCPICQGELQATRLQCTNCQGVVESRFDLGSLVRLNREQLQFVEILVKNRGNINKVADELGVSYTTARNRMDDIVATLGYNAPASRGPSAERVDVLSRLERGELSPEDALEMLRETR